MQACYLFTIILRMSTAVNRETIKRKRGEEGVGWGGVGCLGGHIIEVGKLILKIGKDNLCKLELN